MSIIHPRNPIWKVACALCVMTSLLSGTQVIFASEFKPFSIKCHVKGSGSESGVDYKLDQDVTYKFENNQEVWIYEDNDPVRRAVLSMSDDTIVIGRRNFFPNLRLSITIDLRAKSISGELKYLFEEGRYRTAQYKGTCEEIGPIGTVP